MPPAEEDQFLSFGDLFRALAHIQERGARAYVLAEKLSEMDVERAACFLAWICRESRRKKQVEFTLIYNALLDLTLFPQRLGVEKSHEIQQAAQAMGFVEVADLLTERESAVMPDEDTASSTPPVFKGVTLGERKAMARGAQMRLLEQLLQDQNPGVIRNLLANPRMTERDILKITSKTPTSPEVLEEVAKSPRWISRYRIKKALILNPYTPSVVSLALLELMLIQDLRSVLESKHLAPELRERARQLWNERRNGNETGLSSQDASEV